MKVEFELTEAEAFTIRGFANDYKVDSSLLVHCLVSTVIAGIEKADDSALKFAEMIAEAASVQAETEDLSKVEKVVGIAWLAMDYSGRS